MYVAENTSRGAECRIVRLWRTTEAREKLLGSIKSGAALEKFADFVRSQGGDAREVYEPSLLPQAPVRLEVPAPSSGYVNHIDAMGVGLVSMHLGGGRATKESEIDLSVGLVLHLSLIHILPLAGLCAMCAVRTSRCVLTKRARFKMCIRDRCFVNLAVKN